MKSNKLQVFSLVAVLALLASICQAMPVLAAKPSQSAQVVSAPVMEKINLNTADSGELQKIRGIGPKYAERILDYRKEHGRFQTAEELVNVKGIGPVKFEKLKDQVTI